MQKNLLKKIGDFTKDGKKNVNLFFSLYKSKVERHTGQLNFKKFNNFEDSQGNKFNQNQNQMNNNPNMQGGNKPMYKSFNNFGGNTSEFPSSAINNNFNNNNMNPNIKQQPQKYNNFDQLPKSGFNQFNNFNNNNNMNSQNMQQQQSQQTKQPDLPEEENEAIGEYIYNFAEQIYPSEASKITGMLMELNPVAKKKLRSGKPEELRSIITSAYKQLTSQQNA